MVSQSMPEMSFSLIGVMHRKTGFSDGWRRYTYTFFLCRCFRESVSELVEKLINEFDSGINKVDLNDFVDIHALEVHINLSAGRGWKKTVHEMHFT